MLEDTLIEEDIHPAYVSAGATHAGLLRSSNQDAFVERGDVGLWGIADGMGGYRDGDVASGMVCKALSGVVQGPTLEATIDSIRERASEVNSKLYAAAVRPINPIVSGSTIAVLLVRRTSCAIVWAGDSRVYRLRHGHLAQLTTDHTWAAELNLEHADEDNHAITRAVGGESALTLDVRRDRVRLGDRFLLCSDGLNHELPDAVIAQLLGEGDVRHSADGLIAATLAAGARDNVTVIVVEAT